jgi:hypothetical protein
VRADHFLERSDYRRRPSNGGRRFAVPAKCRRRRGSFINDQKPGGKTMANIEWLHNYDEGLKRAGNEKKPLFLDFFKEG